MDFFRRSFEVIKNLKPICDKLTVTGYSVFLSYDGSPFAFIEMGSKREAYALGMRYKLFGRTD